MADVRRLVLDVLKPHEPALLEFTEQLARDDTVTGVTATLIELDEEVQNVEITLEGTDLDYDAVEAAIESLGGTVHSVDQVACGNRVVPDHLDADDLVTDRNRSPDG